MKKTMIEMFNQFIQHFDARDIGINPKSFEKIFYNFSIFLINSNSDITSEIDQQIEQKIKDSINIVIDKYEENNQKTKKVYLMICFDYLLIIIEESMLTLLKKYFSMNAYITNLFLSDSKSIFTQYINNDFQESTVSGHFIDYAYESFVIIMRNPFWPIIGACIIKYLLLKSYQKTLKNRIDDFFNEPIEKSKEMKELSTDDYIQLNHIGSGSGSVVFLYYDIENESFFVGKKFNNISNSFTKLQTREISNLLNISHPFLPKFVGIFNSSEQIIVALEYINGQSLINYFWNKKEEKIEEKMKIIFEIMLVIEYLHGNNYVYRDLKPSNVIIDSNKTAVLIDFDRMLKSDTHVTGTMIDYYFAAPEVQNGKYEYASDIYSIGVIIYYVLIGKNPEMNDDKFNFEKLPENLNKIKEICYKCTEKNTKLRPTITDLIVDFYVEYYRINEKELFDMILLLLSKSKNHSLQFKLGLLYYEGKVVPKDDKKSFLLFCLAANNNSSEAQYYLGLMYFEGNDFVSKNSSLAEHYFSLVSDSNSSAKDILNLLQKDSNGIELSFQELPLNYQLQLDSIEDPNLAKICSNFIFLYLPLKTIYIENKKVSDELIETFLINFLNEYKFMTFELYDRLPFSGEESKINDDVVDVVICVEGFCFIIESINQFLILRILNRTNASFINLSESKDQIDVYSKEKSEVFNFWFNTGVDYLSQKITQFTFDSIICFLIRRYFYPSYYFKNPSFFIFDPHQQRNEIKEKEKLQISLNKKDFESVNSIIESKENSKEIFTFYEDDLVDLNDGSDSLFHLVMHIETLHVFMMKRVENIDSLKSEIEFCSNYSHRCLMKFYGFVKNDDDEIIGLVYEHLNNGNLHDYILYHQYMITPTYSYISMIRIFQGIEYLQSNSLIHSDLNLENILLDHDFIPYITKFDSIQKIDDQKQLFENDSKISLFSSPEQYIEHHLYLSSNIYSFGRIIYFLFEKRGFDSINDLNSYQNVFLNYELKKNVTENISNLYEMCVKFNKEERIKIKEIRDIILKETNSLFYIEKANFEEEENKEKIISEIIQYLYESIIIEESKLSLSLLEYASETLPKLKQQMKSAYSKSNDFTVTIHSDVELIEESKYEGVSTLTNVLFINPSSLKRISSSSFKDCTALMQISIPPSVESIGSFSFYNCSKMTQILIPSSVKNIDFSAFEECSSLIQVTIPSSVTKISSATFKSCSSLVQITNPSSVTEIGVGSFYDCSSLSEITIPSSVTKIGEKAFANCSSLNEITIPSSVIKIGKNAFEKCSLLKRIKIPSSIQEINEGAFCDCNSLTEIIIPSSVTIIGKSAFEKCSSLEQITIPNSVVVIGDSSFCECTSLSKITIPNSVTKLGENVFTDCYALDQFIIPHSIAVISSGLFCECSSLTEIEIPSSITEICDFAFYKCPLSKVTIPNSVTKIGRGAFSKCKKLSQIFLPCSLKEIEEGAFSNCFSLAQIDIPSSITKISAEMFKKCTILKKVTIPSFVTEIGDSAFKKCSELIEIKIPSSVTRIGKSAFSCCSKLTEIKIPSSVTKIEDDAFNECSMLNEIEIPSSVTEFGRSLFCDCSSLTEISIPSSVTEIVGTFSSCSSLTKIKIPSSVEKIDEWAFSGCSSLMQVTFELPSSLKIIGKYSFSQCSMLKQIEIPSSVTEIGSASFFKCSSLSRVLLYSSTIKIDEEAFQECCPNLTIKMIPSSEIIINENAFKSCSSVKIKANLSSNFSHLFIEEIKEQLIKHPQIEGRKRAVLFTSGSFCPIQKCHLKLFDIASNFLSNHYHIDSIIGIISPKSDLYVSLKYNNSSIPFHDRYEMVKLACDEHNSEINQKLKIIPDNWEGSLIDFLDFQLVYDKIKEKILDEFQNENLIILFVCDGDLFIKRNCSIRKGFIGVSVPGFKIESQTNKENHVYVCNDFSNDQNLILRLKKDNFELMKKITYDSVTKYLQDAVHWV